MSKKNTTGKLPVWDLSEYYKNEDDVKIDKDLALYTKKAKSFAAKYRGKVAKLNADVFLKALHELEDLSNLGSRLGGFAHLNSTTKMKEQKATALYQRIVETLTTAGTNLVFFNLEYNKLGKA